jgi:hypothetical protein
MIKLIINFPFVKQNDRKLQTSQGYIIRILQHFATKRRRILLILWWLFKLWWKFCPGRSRSKFHKYRASNSIIAVIHSNGVFAWIASRPRLLQKMENLGFATKNTPRVVHSFALIKTARCTKRLCQCGEGMDQFIRCVILPKD